MFSFLFAAATGAAAMYFLDKENGERRRNQARDRMMSFAGGKSQRMDTSYGSPSRASSGYQHSQQSPGTTGATGTYGTPSTTGTYEHSSTYEKSPAAGTSTSSAVANQTPSATTDDSTRDSRPASGFAKMDERADELKKAA
jgi:hypothetical protein